MAVLIGTECILLLLGFGYSTSFFRGRQINGHAVLTENPDFGRRFFPPGLVRYAQPFVVPAHKPPGTLRVFVLGESAAMGDPDFKFGLPKMLEVLLRERFPDRHIEVINTAVVAIDSHVILPIARDCARHEGDLWVIYMGNNEMIGPFGSASVFGARAPALPLVRAGLWLKSTRLGQLFDAGLRLVRSGNQLRPEWAGMEMMANQRVPADSPATQIVYRHFARNLADLLETGARAHVPILLCTVATNLKDCAPFASLHRPGLTAVDLAQWEKSYAAGIAAQEKGEFKEALSDYARAADTDDKFADLAFRQGDCSRLLGHSVDADKFFRRARNEDALQFRADDQINNRLRQSAAAFSAGAVRLLDADTLFETNSPQGLVGAEYFYEHVHLLPEGNYLLARNVAEQAADLLALKPSGPWLSFAECLRSLGFTDWNRFDALNVIYDRIQKAPFTNQLDHARQLKSLGEQLEQYRLATKPAQLRQEAARVSQLVAKFPRDPDLRWNLGALLENAGNATGAEEQWRNLITLQPQSPLPPFNLGRLLESLGRNPEALQSYELASLLRPDYYQARYASGALSLRLDRISEALVNLELAVRLKPDSVEARLALAQAFVRAGKKSSADKQLHEVLLLDPNNQSARLQLNQGAATPSRN